MCAVTFSASLPAIGQPVRIWARQTEFASLLLLGGGLGDRLGALAAVRLAMTCASGLYLAAFLVVALIRDERPARRVVENAPVIE